MKQQDRTLHDLLVHDIGFPDYTILDEISLDKFIDYIIELMIKRKKPP